MRNRLIGVAALITAACLFGFASAGPPPFCPGDVDKSGEVDADDLLIVIGDWGPCHGRCQGDCDDSGEVDMTDLLIVLGNWGSCY
jgi:hypothetical protein